MKLWKFLINWNYHSLVRWTNRLECQVSRSDFREALKSDGVIINKFNYGIDREEWIRLTRIRMNLHFRTGNIIQAWQLGNNLMHMMGDDSQETMDLYDKIVAEKEKLA